MKALLQAAFDASLLTASHSVFFRLPGTDIIRGMCSEHLHPGAAEKSGFIVQPYNTHEEPEVIIPEIKFTSASHTFLETYYENDFTERYQAMFRHCIENAADLRCTPFYQPNTDEDTSQAAYAESVEKALDAIRSGKVNKLVCSRIKRFSCDTNRHISALFMQICAAYPGAFVVLLSSPHYGTWLGASPEVLLEQNGSSFHTVSQAGTVDNASGASFTDKERKEQDYITRFVTESLPQECRNLSVSDTYPVNTRLISHLKTDITFEAPPELRSLILQVLHPTPAVCGYPKKESGELLSATEKHTRNLYSGYWGLLDETRANLYVNIRCMQYQENSMLLYAGAGITEASVHEKEWEETGNKLNVLAKFLQSETVN